MPTKKRYPPMYNYCDYRCEKCWYAWYKNHCPVRKIDTKRLLQHQLAGENPYDMKTVLNDVRDDLQTALELMRRGAKKWRVDADKLPPGTMPRKPRPSDMVACRQARAYTTAVHEFLKEWNRVRDTVKQELTSEIDDVSLYHTLIPAKLYRAEIGLWESNFEDKEVKPISREDAFMSAHIVLRSIEISVDVWKKIYHVIKDDKVIHYLNLLKKIKTIIKKKFTIDTMLTPMELYSLVKKSFDY